MKKQSTLILTAIILLIAQLFFWFGINTGEINEEGEPISIWKGTKNIKPDLEIVPRVPSKEILKAFALGDEQALFRYNSYILQFAGDTFGRVTALKDYDYPKLYRWWTLLDEIDSKSDLLAYMVGYYYSSSQTPKLHTPYVVDFLEQHADKHPSDKWWWYSQAVYNAKFKMEDNERALGIAKKLADLPAELDIPIWTRQLQAYIYEDEGEYAKACDIIVNVVEDYIESQLTEGEINFIFHFVQKRLRDMIAADKTEDIKVSGECRELMATQKAQDIKLKQLGLM